MRLPALPGAFEGAVLDAILCEVADRERPEGIPMRHRLARRAADFLHASCREPLSISLCNGARRGTSETLGRRMRIGSAPRNRVVAERDSLRRQRGRTPEPGSLRAFSRAGFPRFADDLYCIRLVAESVSGGTPDNTTCQDACASQKQDTRAFVSPYSPDSIAALIASNSTQAASKS